MGKKILMTASGAAECLILGSIARQQRRKQGEENQYDAPDGAMIITWLHSDVAEMWMMMVFRYDSLLSYHIMFSMY